MSFMSFISGMNPFRAKPPVPEGGFAGFLERMRQQAPPNMPTATEKQLAETFSTDEVDAFLHFGQWLPVNSTNVKEIRYQPDDSQLFVEFKNGNIYYYDDVSIREAEHLARSSSKGGWVWDFLRVRGKGNFWAYRKPYGLMSGVSQKLPQWMRSEKVRKLHGKIGPEGLRNKGIARILAPKWGGGK